ncbi:MAG TPA: YqaJ viral recombinase family protein [Vicinamibacterales bacterium]|nr:YqaJ viral recombinase family protein [Vicinamibacterales bacterium]
MTRCTVHNVAQRSSEWFALRAGKLTGSRAAAVLARIKSGEAAARRDLRMQLVCERLSGQPQEDGFVSPEMRRGIELEPRALAAYEIVTGALAQTTGFLSLPDLMAGCSPDGYVGDFDTLVSLKCPKTATHIGYLRAGTMPSDYVPQMLHELWITGAREYHFLSFDDRLPERLQTCLIRVPRDEQAVQDYADQAKRFLAEVDRELEALNTLADTAGQLIKAAS